MQFSQYKTIFYPLQYALPNAPYMGEPAHKRSGNMWKLMFLANTTINVTVKAKLYRIQNNVMPQ